MRSRWSVHFKGGLRSRRRGVRSLCSSPISHAANSAATQRKMAHRSVGSRLPATAAGGRSFGQNQNKRYLHLAKYDPLLFGTKTGAAFRQDFQRHIEKIHTGRHCVATIRAAISPCRHIHVKVLLQRLRKKHCNTRSIPKKMFTFAIDISKQPNGNTI